MLFCMSLAQLTSKEPLAREEACRATLHLASQCSDYEIVSQVTKQLFAVLNGKQLGLEFEVTLLKVFTKL